MAVTVSEFPDVSVWVKNENEGDWSLYFDSKEYVYPAGKAVRVPAEVAWFHFAFDTRGGKNQRDYEGSRDERGVSWYENRLTSYGVNTKHGAEIRQQFKKFKFKVMQAPPAIEAVDFDKIK